MRPARRWAAGLLPASLLWLCLPLAAHADCSLPPYPYCDSTFFVCQTGGPCAYSDIQAAVYATMSASGNACVVICDGQTYNTAAPITISGDAPDQLVIAGTPDTSPPTIAPAGSGDAVFTIDKENVILENLIIDAGHQYDDGIKVKSNYNSIINNTIIGANNDGIEVKTGDNSIISNTIIGAIKNGIQILGMASGGLSNFIDSNIIADAGENGIDISYNTNSTISNNTITNAGGAGISIFQDESNSTTINNNTISSSGGGIVLTGNGGNTLDSNTIKSLSGDGIDLMDGGGDTVTLSSVTALSTGIYVNAPNITLSSNIVTGAQWGLAIDAGAAPGLAISSLTFQNLQSGATAINFTNGTFGETFLSTFTSVAFNETGGVNINASPLSAASTIWMATPTGMIGHGFSDDPDYVVHWPAVPCACSGNPCYVRPDGAYTTITSALNAIPASYTGDQCIYTDTSTYTEQVAVAGKTPGDGVSVIKIQLDPAIYALNHATATVVNPPTGTAAFQILNASVTIANIDIIPASNLSYGVYASSPNITITSVNVIDPGGNIATAGVYFDSQSGYNTVSCSSVTVAATFASGLLLHGSSMTAVSYSSVLANYSNTSANGGAVFLNGASSNTFTALQTNDPATYGLGVLFAYGSSNNSITQSTMTGKSDGLVLYSGFNSVSWSYMYGSGDAGASIQSDYNTINYSTMAASAGSEGALYLNYATNNSVSWSYMYGVATDGALIRNSSNNNSITQSTMTGTIGLVLGNAVGTECSSNSVSGSYMFGTSIGAEIQPASNLNTISQSTMIGGGSYGLWIYQSSSNTAAGCYIQGSPAVLIQYSTETAINYSALVSPLTNGIGLAMANGSVDLDLSSSSIQGGAGGEAVYLEANNSGLINLSSNTITGPATGAYYGLLIATQGAAGSPFTGLSISSMTFNSLPAGTTAINFLGGQFLSTFTSVAFNETSGANINASPLAPSSTIWMSAPAGNLSGATYIDDPSQIVHWPAVPIVSTLISPASGIAVDTTTPVLVWSSAVSGNSELQLAKDSGFAQVVADSTTANTFYISTNTLTNATTYWWRVGIAATPNSWSSTFSFVVDIVPPVYSGSLVSTSPTGSFMSLPMTSYLSTTTASVKISVQDSNSGLLVSTGLPAGLVGQWHFDESSGSVALDASPNAYNGTLVGNPAWVAGKRGSALSFNGNQQFVSLPSGIVQGLTSFTFASWVYWNSASAWQRVFDFGTGTDVYMFLTLQSDLGKPRFAISLTSNAGEQTLDAPAALSAGSWHHIAVTLDHSASLGTMYIDGVAVASNAGITLSPNSLDNTNKNFFGKSQFAVVNHDPYLSGMLDDARLFGVALSSAQILNMFQSDTLAAQNRGQAYSVYSSTTAGAVWNFVSTASVRDMTGSNGAQTSTLEADNIPVVTSTGPGAATNQVAFVASDLAGNVSTATYVILVDTGAAPQAPTLSAVVVASTTIRWAWTENGGAATSFGFYYSTGTSRASLPAGTSYFIETGLSTSTAYSRYVVSQRPSSQAQSSTVTVVTPVLQSFTVGAASATLTGTDGASAQIPGGLLGNTTAWLISEIPVQNPLTDNTVVLISSALANPPAGVSGSSASITEFILAINGIRSTATFASPVIVSVPYTDFQAPGFVDGTNPPVRASTLQLYVLNETTALWEEVAGSSVNTTTHLVSGYAPHLSIYTALGTASLAAADLSNVLVYPIPYRPNGGDPNRGRPYVVGDFTTGIVFANLPNAVTIDIYTITGRRVKSLDTTASSGKVQWNVQNDNGQDVASGGYVAVISSPGVGKITRKLIIVR